MNKVNEPDKIYVLKLYSESAKLLFSCDVRYLFCFLPPDFLKDRSNSRLYIMSTVLGENSPSAYKTPDENSKIVGYVDTGDYTLDSPENYYYSFRLRGNIVFDGNSRINLYVNLKPMKLAGIFVSERTEFSEPLDFHTAEMLVPGIFSLQKQKMAVYLRGTGEYNLISLWGNRFRDDLDNDFMGYPKDVIKEFRGQNGHCAGKTGTVSSGGCFSGVKKLLRMR